MKKIFNILWACRTTIILTWLMLFLLGLSSYPIYNIVILFLVAGLFSIALVFITILIFLKNMKL